MPDYDTDILADLCRRAEVVVPFPAGRSRVALRISGRIEGNIQVEGIPHEVRRIGSCTVIRSGYRVTGTSIGRFCSIGPNVQFGNPEHQTGWLSTSSAFRSDYSWMRGVRNFPLSKDGLVYRETRVGNDVWVGRDVFVKAGLTIGDGAIIGAGAMVTKDVPPYAIVGGNPARILKYRFPDEVIADLVDLAWWDLDPEWIGQTDYRDITGCIRFLRANRQALKPFTPVFLDFAAGNVRLCRQDQVLADYAALKAEKDERTRAEAARAAERAQEAEEARLAEKQGQKTLRFRLKRLMGRI